MKRDLDHKAEGIGHKADDLDRKDYIGGSDVAAIVNVDPFKTAIELWEEKLHGPKPLTQEEEIFFAMRRKMEPLVVARLRREFGIVASRVSHRSVNRYRDAQVPEFGAEIDFETRMTPALALKFPLLRDIPSGEIVNGEIKTVNPRRMHLWGAMGEDEPIMPDYVAAQAYWGQGVTGRRATLVCPLIGFDELRVLPLRHVAETVSWLREEALAFLVLVREHRMPAPRPSDVDDVKRALLHLRGRRVELDDAALEALEEIVKLRGSITEFEKSKKTQEYLLFDYLRRAWGVPCDPTAELPAEDAVFTYRGRPVASYNLQGRTDVDQKRLKAEDPATYERFKRESTHRVLRKLRGEF